MRNTLVIFILSILNIFVYPQSYTISTRYSEKDGLSEINVINILQDKKGQMWFVTYDGLNLFNGYYFKTFKHNPDASGGLTDYRVDFIKQDTYDNLWLLTYDGGVYKFNPKTERFFSVPQSTELGSDYKIKFNNLYISQDGTVWASSSKDGCYRIKKSEDNSDLKYSHFSEYRGNLSSNVIHNIYTDKQQQTWILTDNGLNLFSKENNVPTQIEKGKTGFYSISEYMNGIWIGGNNGKVLHYKHHTGKFMLIKAPCLSPIIEIKQYDEQNVFILTKNEGFYIYNLNTQKFKTFNTKSGCGMISNVFHSAYFDKRHNFWLETDNPSVVYFDTKNQKINNFNTGPETTRAILPLRFFVLEDKNGNTWVNPRFGGLRIYNPVQNKLLSPDELSESTGRKFPEFVHTAYSDRQGNLWLSPYSHEIEKVVFVKSPFRFHKVTGDESSSSSNEVRALFQDKKERIWVATKNGIVNIYNRKHEKIGCLCTNGTIGKGTPLKIMVYAVYEDSNENIWLGTKGNGLFKLKEKSQFQFSFDNFTFNENDLYSISSNNIYTILEDRFKRMWIGTYGGGINLMDPHLQGRFLNARNTFTSYPTDKCSKVRYLTEDKNGIIYAGTTGGLIAFRNTNGDPAKYQFAHLMYESGTTGKISGNDIHYILPSKTGKLYLSIFGGGLNVLDKPFSFDEENVFRTISKKDGAPSDIFYTIREDEKNHIWFSTQTTTGKYIPEKKIFETYKPYNKNNYVFIEAASCFINNNELAFGTSEGYVSFEYKMPLKSNYVPNIIFTDLQLFNKSVTVGGNDSPLTQILDETTKLVLNHNQSVITISFSALDFTNTPNIQYAYKLEGFDKEWNYVRNQNSATYTNLPKGKYTFKVKSTNGDGIWVDNERSLTIVKEPSFWESFTGYLFYCMVFITIVIISSYIIHKFYVLRTNSQLEHRISNMKLQFFTDISHELRTPLTLIASPVEYVLRNENLTESGKKQLSLVQKNIDRMLRLITQILDFRKIQNNKMKLQIEPINTVAVIKEIADSFLNTSENAFIEYFFDKSDSFVVWADKDKFEKIFYNLLSNAFKFSKTEIRIKITLASVSDTITISITDNGIGIEPGRMKQLFNRYESFINASDIYHQSTGIGLSLTKELVELHHGRIEAESTPGLGSTFRVIFAKGRMHFGSEDENAENTLTETNAETSTVNTEDNNSNAANNEKQQILIVEDNDELREFLKDILYSKFDILEASNGLIAMNILKEETPDLIITDVMMPGMDGIELSKAIRGNINICHIPIILLTARTDMDVKVEALKYGVDDYLTKPFSATYLDARIENILASRKKLQEYYRTTMTLGKVASLAIQENRQDDIFVEKVIHFIDKNIENTELTIDDIAAHLAMGRSTFFKKLKSLIGISPVEFLKDYRIQKAAELIISTELNFTEIADKVGINDLSYFSRCFKQKFGVPPREYRDSIQK